LGSRPDFYDGIGFENGMGFVKVQCHLALEGRRSVFVRDGELVKHELPPAFVTSLGLGPITVFGEYRRKRFVVRRVAPTVDLLRAVVETNERAGELDSRYYECDPRRYSSDPQYADLLMRAQQVVRSLFPQEVVSQKDQLLEAEAPAKLTPPLPKNARIGEALPPPEPPTAKARAEIVKICDRLPLDAYVWSPQSSEIELEAWERRHGVRLPMAYRLFLRTIANGAPGPGQAKIPPLEDAPLVTKPAFPGVATSTPDKVRWGALRIGWDQGGENLLVLTGPARGNVWVYFEGEFLKSKRQFTSWYLSQAYAFEDRGESVHNEPWVVVWTATDMQDHVERDPSLPDSFVYFAKKNGGPPEKLLERHPKPVLPDAQVNKGLAFVGQCRKLFAAAHKFESHHMIEGFHPAATLEDVRRSFAADGYEVLTATEALAGEGNGTIGRDLWVRSRIENPLASLLAVLDEHVEIVVDRRRIRTVLDRFSATLRGAAPRRKQHAALSPGGVLSLAILLVLDVFARASTGTDEMAAVLATLAQELHLDPESRELAMPLSKLPLDLEDIDASWATDALARIGLPPRWGPLLVVGHGVAVTVPITRAQRGHRRSRTDGCF